MTCIQPKIRHDEALAMYSAGANDRQIAERFDAVQSAVAHWRARNNLPSKRATPKRVSIEKTRRARKLLRGGAAKKQVAEELGISTSTVQNIRKTMPSEGLRQPGGTQRSIRNAVVSDPTIYPRILRAVGTGLPRDVKHDAANELYVDVLSGKLSVDLIEARAPRYRNWAWSMCGSNYGPVSLDAANDDDLCLGDLIEDPSAMQEMDDAAERGWGRRSRILESL